MNIYSSATIACDVTEDGLGGIKRFTLSDRGQPVFQQSQAINQKAGATGGEKWIQNIIIIIALGLFIAAAFNSETSKTPKVSPRPSAIEQSSPKQSIGAPDSNAAAAAAAAAGAAAAAAAVNAAFNTLDHSAQKPKNLSHTVAK